MSLTLQQLIDQAISIATAGMDPSLSGSLSAEMVAEDLLSSVFNKVGVEQAENPRTRTLLQRTKTIAVANGSVVLDPDVLTSYIGDSTLLDPLDLTKVYTLVPNWSEFVVEDAGFLGLYALEGEDTLHVVEPNTAYDSATGPSESLLLTIPCAPVIPTTPAGVINIIEELENDLIEALAEGLKLGVRAARSASRQ